VFPVGAYLAAQNCREGQFPESLTTSYHSHSLPDVMAVTKKREAFPGLWMTALQPERNSRMVKGRDDLEYFWRGHSRNARDFKIWPEFSARAAMCGLGSALAKLTSSRCSRCWNLQPDANR
jgi:hypothetical protein